MCWLFMFLILCLLCTSVSCNSIKIKYLPYENNIERINKMDFCTQSNVLLFSLLSAQFSKQSHHRSHPKLPPTHHSIHKISWNQTKPTKIFTKIPNHPNFNPLPIQNIHDRELKNAEWGSIVFVSVLILHYGIVFIFIQSSWITISTNPLHPLKL